jgi:hypothetical protein
MEFTTCGGAPPPPHDHWPASLSLSTQIGAKGVHIEDLREDFLKNYILPSIQTNGIYENLYLMGTSLGEWGSGGVQAVRGAPRSRR